MGIFVRTLVITLLICMFYFIYAFIGKESYSPTLTPNNTSFHKAIDKKQTSTQQKISICFINSANKPVLIKRNSENPSLESALRALMGGVLNSEDLQGLYTEIPKGTRIISFSDDGNKIAINLSKEFEGGGGAQSIQARLLQVVKTVNAYTKEKPVYLYIEGKMAEYLGGEGIFVEQPLNEDKLKF